MMANLRVDQAVCPYGCNLGISQYVGKQGNRKIQLLISLNQANNNQNSIGYRIKSRDLTTNEQTILTQGTFGDFSGGWANGDSRTVAFARVGSEFWFYVVGAPGLIKIQALDEISSFDGTPDTFAWAGSVSSISGSVSNIYLIKE